MFNFGFYSAFKIFWDRAMGRNYVVVPFPGTVIELNQWDVGDPSEQRDD